LTWIRKELQELGIPPLKRFGQHFLLDEKIRHAIVATAQPTATDRILEVGPGLGYVTAELLKHSCQVVAVEKDRTLAPHLRHKFAKYSNLTVIQGDALETGNLGCNKVVSSPPYNISSKLVLFVIQNKIDRTVLLLQNEFVQRLTANCGSREYGRLSVILQSRAEAKRIAKVPRTAFYPIPRVDSAIVEIIPKKTPPFIADDTIFEELVRHLFTQRKRKLNGVLTRYLREQAPRKADSILSQINFLEKRIFQMDPAELIAISNLIAREKTLGSSLEC